VLAAASDPAPPVRAWASWAARALARHDPEAACVAAESLLDAGGPPLGYQTFGRLLDALWPTHGDALEPRIRAALSVTDPAHAQMLVRALCHDQLTRCSSYSQAPPFDRDQPLHRRFAAGATREWIGHPRHGGLARRQLIDFFADPDPEVRREANPFWDPEHDGPSPLLPEHHELHLAFARSPACADAPLGILRALKQDPGPDAELVLEVSTSLLRRIQSQGDDVRLTELAFYAYDLAELLSRLARDPTADIAHRDRATADIEALLQAQVPGVSELWHGSR